MPGEINFIKGHRSCTTLPRRVSRISRSFIAQACDVLASRAVSRSLRFAQAAAVLVATEFAKLKLTPRRYNLGVETSKTISALRSIQTLKVPPQVVICRNSVDFKHLKDVAATIVYFHVGHISNYLKIQ